MSVFAKRGRRVRVHLKASGPSIDGVMVRRRPLAGHYMVMLPRVIEDEERSVTLEGEAAIPQDGVLFLQFLPGE